MPDHDARALLREALDFFNDRPRFSLRRDRSRNSYELASRIDALLARDKPALAVVAAARERWEAANLLRVDANALAVEHDEEGYWVRAWVRVNSASIGDTPASQAERYAKAIAALPETTRDVLLGHQRDRQDLSAIASRLGINTRDVEQHLADAILAIGRALDGA
ncbi:MULTISPECIES: sigma factor-like helix-turn-helix DNA-binding protein [unclassified Novosphingobium]|uniref:sigma factor-like helix-turn-helix DNA-binding protein n=1 Tax=unclassified Novosphingobium TaxID=2644732 RepID=UPI00146AC076|nr:MULTISPECIES: sigma factor-like helix-turn-helix DNA-binding protein [unclassified Novosphingobium]NMN06740.1 DNA-directed RNA polymerase specialized sigma24 family protein [Novosphingobium sp. SG919]NMN88809.1 DNA-directed RNA polymerase specialized sigma24 family protein [Novosphingobium sp. SG916]